MAGGADDKENNSNAYAMFVGDIHSGEYKKWKRGVRRLRWAESVEILNTVVRKAPG